ncbi:MAG: RIP metalloprotease RseP [Planctomycetota bacterium]|nr:RIP metalloprotease RseP [Planctomycetota bacterium]
MEIIAVDILLYWSQYIWPFLMFIIGLGLVVFVHEFGHFIAAKWAGVKVEEFALGFGKKLIGLRRGETLYRLNAFPLGGYVKMLGQDDFNAAATAEDDARSWQRSPAGKKLVILSAGVAMNVVFSVVLFVIVYMIGIRFIAPVVGSTQPGYPAATAVLPDKVAEAMGTKEAVGLQSGDRILAINGKETRRFNQIRMAAGLSDDDEKFDLKVARKIKGREITFNVALTPKKAEIGSFGKHYVFGIGQPVSTIIEMPGKEGYTGLEHFKKGDRIVEFAGEPIEQFRDLAPAFRNNAGKRVEIIVERNGRRVGVQVQPLEISGGDGEDDQENLTILGISPRIRVVDVFRKSPAEKAGLEIGDIILQYAGQGVPSRAELLEINMKYANTETSIRVLRDGETLDLKITPEKEKQDENALIGITPAPEQDKPFVARVQADSPAAKAGVAEGAVITKINDTPVTTWAEVFAALQLSAGKKTVLTYTLVGSEQKGAIDILTKEMFDPEGYSFTSPAIGAISFLKTDLIRGNLLQALGWGTEDTVMFMASVYKSLRNIFKERVSTKGISGPVGIGAIAIMMGREGAIELAYFMAMLSALVAVFNFLPLPVLDGGHVVLVLIEKVRGRPLPTKALVGIQLVGWILFGGLFLALTYQDIVRFVFGE